MTAVSFPVRAVTWGTSDGSPLHPRDRGCAYDARLLVDAEQKASDGGRAPSAFHVSYADSARTTAFARLRIIELHIFGRPDYTYLSQAL